MTKIKDLALTSAILIPCLIGLVTTASQASKKEIKPKLDMCNLKVGERGIIKGVVTETRKEEYGWYRLAVLKEGMQGCPVVVKYHPNATNSGLIKPGNKLAVGIQVDSEYSSSLIDGKITTDHTILDEKGEVAPTETIEQTLGNNIIPKRGSLTLTYGYGYGGSYYFSEELVKQLKPHKKFRWFYQRPDPNRNFFIVNSVEEVN